MNTPRKVAIFDVDGTIFRSSLFIELVEGMIEAGIFDKTTREIYLKKRNAWLDRKGTYEDYIEAVVKAFMVNIKGVPFKDFDTVVKEVISVHKDRVYKFTRDLVAKLKKQKYFLLAISQSPKGILDGFCKRMGFDKIYGRFYEVGPTEQFTGSIIDLHLISNKANIVRRAVAKHELTLKGSVGVGDTEGDISFLELVQNPICFNPNEKLYRHALRNDWRIVVERKDVVYEIKK